MNNKLFAGFSNTHGMCNRLQTRMSREVKRMVALPCAIRRRSASDKSGLPMMKVELRGPPPSRSWRARDHDEQGVPIQIAATT